MSYDGRLMRQALARFDEDKQRRAENFRARERAVYTKCPRIEEIDRELSHTMAKIIASGLRRGTDPRPAIEALREENLNLQQEKRLLLTRLGLPGDYLEEKPKCSRCNDTGFLGSEVCSCLRGYYAKEQNKELSGLLDLGSQCFENFNFDYYSSVPDEDLGVSPRTNMERVYDICQDYAHEFSPKSGNLLLTGGTGLGKTFLSASIARVVSASGHSVVYDTAGHIFSRFEAQKFSRGEDGAELCFAGSDYRAAMTNLRGEASDGMDVLAAVRPEEFLLSTGEGEGIPATVRSSVFLGTTTHYFLTLPTGQEIEAVRDSDEEWAVIPDGAEVRLRVKPRRINVFTADGKRSLVIREELL